MKSCLGGGGGGYAAAPPLVLLFFLAVLAVEVRSAVSGYGRPNFVVCPKRSLCRGRLIRCPAECPYFQPWHPRGKRCEIDCNSPKCEAVCEAPVYPCDKPGSGCQDPRFIGGDGVVFYFHGRKDEHFTLVSDPRFQVNARFIGLRPAGRTRDFTWINALGFMFGSHRFTVEATKAEQWDGAMDHLQFSYDGEPLELPEGHRSAWGSPGHNELTTERMGRTNNVTVMLRGLVAATINVIPLTKKDDRVHKYQLPSDDCFVHLDVRFNFYGLSPEVDGVLGRTYRPDYVNPAKLGASMPVVGGEDKYWTSSLVSPRCSACVFTPAGSPGASVIVQVADN